MGGVFFFFLKNNKVFILLTDEICVCLCKQLDVFAAGKGPVGMCGAAAILVYCVCVCSSATHPCSWYMAASQPCSLKTERLL